VVKIKQEIKHFTSAKTKPLKQCFSCFSQSQSVSARKQRIHTVVI